MTRWTRMVSAVCLALTLSSAAAKAVEKAPPVKASALGVATLMGEPEKHRGPVLVEGVVAKVFPKEQKLGVIDADEFRRCGTVTCAAEILPVKWAGALPEPKSFVRIEGEIRKGAAGLEFVARSVEKIQPAQAGKR